MSSLLARLLTAFAAPGSPAPATWITLISVWYGVWSLIAAILHAADKSRARRGARRIPERTLHLAELVGGWPGALLARRMLRHKTSKRSYRLAFAAIVVAHAMLWAAVTWLFFRA